MTCGGIGKARQLEQSKVLKLWGANPHHVLALTTQTQLNDQLACRSYIMPNAIERFQTLSVAFLLEKIMDEETKKRLRHIRSATKVNKEHAENTRRQSVERHERSRAQVKAEIYDNRNINYRKHVRF